MWKSVVLLQVGLTIAFSLTDPATLARRDITVDRGDYIQICKQLPLEIGIVLDSSSSIRDRDFRAGKKFLQDFLSQYEIGSAPNDVRVSLISYGKGIYPEIGFNLTTYDSEEKVLNATGNIKHKAGLQTDTGKAIRYMHLYQLAQGIVRPGVARIGIVITDGNSQNWRFTKRAAESARNDGIKMFAIGVGASETIRDSELLNIAGDFSQMTRVDNYSELQSIKESLAHQTCFVERNKTTSHPLHIDDMKTTISLPIDIDVMNTTISLPTVIGEMNSTISLPTEIGEMNTTISLPTEIGEMNTTISLPTDIGEMNTTISLPTDIVEQTITTPSSLNFKCGDTDILFVFSPADLGPDRTIWATSLIYATVDSAYLATGFKYGVLSGFCQNDEGFNLDEYNNIDDIKRRVFEYERLHVLNLVQTLAGIGFSPVWGAREKVRNVAVIVTEGKSVGVLEPELATLSSIGVQVIISNTSEIEQNVSDATVLTGRTPELQAENLVSILCGPEPKY